MQPQAIEASLFFCIFSLGAFLGAGVRSLLMPAMRDQPALVGPILTAMFSRYNLLALALAAICLSLEGAHHPSLLRLFTAAALTLTLSLKLPIDTIVKRREGSGQVRGQGLEGKRLDILHKLAEGATVAVLILSLASFLSILLDSRHI
jgi:hypothetical protein